MKLFISGSKSILKLEKSSIKLIERALQNKHQILIGDADGIDRIIQEYLKNAGYSDVTVYCVESNCRNNIGGWNTKNIPSKIKSKGFRYYVQKDLAMAQDGDVAFMIWDRKSAGTLNNVLNMLELSKPSTVVEAHDGKIIQIQTINDFKKLIDFCDINTKNRLDKKINFSKILERISVPSQPMLPIERVGSNGV